MSMRLPFSIGASGIGLLLLCCIAPMNLAAGPFYELSAQRSFGTAAGRNSSSGNQPFTPTTNDVLQTNYSDGNSFNGLSSISQGSVVMETSTSVTVNQAITTDNVVGFLARNRVTLYDSLVVTGGTGTAYLVPVVHITGTFVDNSSLLFGGLSACFGTGGCVLLAVPGGFSTGGVQNVDVMWSPSPSVFPPTFEITFGNTQTAFMFFGTSVTAWEGQGVNIPAGNSLSADFRFELLGYRVLDKDGNLIPGAVVRSEALSQVPEPESAAMGAIGLVLFLAFARRKR